MPMTKEERWSRNRDEMVAARRRLCAAVLEEAAQHDLGRARLLLEWSGLGDEGTLDFMEFRPWPSGTPTGPDLPRIRLSPSTRSLASDFVDRLVNHFPETEGLDNECGGHFRCALDVRDGACESTAEANQEAEDVQVQRVDSDRVAHPWSLLPTLTGPMAVPMVQAQAIVGFCAGLGGQLAEGGALAEATSGLEEVTILVLYSGGGDEGELESVSVEDAKRIPGVGAASLMDALDAVDSAIRKLLTPELEEALCKAARDCGHDVVHDLGGYVHLQLTLPGPRAANPGYSLSRVVYNWEESSREVEFNGRLPADPEIAAHFARGRSPDADPGAPGPAP